MDHIGGRKRTHYCGEPRPAHIGQQVIVAGWVQRRRDLGALIFVDLRDRTGLLQLAFDEACPADVLEKARGLRGEYVVMATGTLRERSAKNPDLPTGEVELAVTELLLLGRSETPPFEIVENCPTSELTRLKYRYLDLRRPDLQRNILMRHKIAKVTRDYFDENGFIEIETPMMIKSTPEGARDYLVPSRVHPGSFYALPQSPQMYKQLCMVAGFDRYIQLARCMRDEDLRADRQPEFTQIDLEMSFVELEDILNMVEGLIERLDRELNLGVAFPIPRMAYRDALERFGSDKPDTRYAMELWNASDLLAGCGFGVFESALGTGCVRGVTAKAAYDALTRKEIDKLAETAKGIGAKGLAWARVAADNTISSSFGKFISEETMQSIIARADAQPGDVIFLVADAKNSLALSVLGALRQALARKLGLIPKGKLNFLWVTDFPFFDWDEDARQFVAMHHPFTSPTDESMGILESDKANVIAKAADLTLNGIEMSSGSIRITDPDLQRRIFSLLGLTQEEINAKFGFLVDAFRYGPPPHGGMGLGLDRLVMQLLGCENLRDVTAFPKVQNASEPMTECPSPVDNAQLKDLGLRLL
ncbi:MAG: aspartate--tRNA ligase [Oscillospiraceae bacterium]|jgi:aspartyl-tRNA synthetase|nr:aspartate--tRNA ligase [Oscillospiraceae bacterium]